VLSAPRRRGVTARQIAAFAALMAGACAEDTRAIDPFPIRIGLDQGAVEVAIDAGDGPVPAIIDTATPLTVLDPFTEGERVPAPRRSRVTVTLIGLDDEGRPTIPRARFPDTAALELHPCPDDQLCSIGLGEDAVPFRAIVGADILARSAARFDFPAAELRFFPDTSGDAAQLSDQCHAVIGDAFAGGGVLLVDGTEVVFGGWRPVIGACLDEENAPDDVERGTDALMILSTGLGVSVLAASAYQRYAVQSDAPALDQLEVGELHLPSGPAAVRLGRIGTAALVGSLGNNSEDQADRGPCRELHLNRVMSSRACGGAVDCPCPDGSDFCTTAAAVDLNRSIDVAILADDHPVLQALRDELRPETPELDGILGTAALAELRLELDYLNDRMLMRCEVGNVCATLPAVRSEQALDALTLCREQEQARPDAGVVDAGSPDAGALDGGGELLVPPRPPAETR
jgi:hypothetical protein